MIRSPAFLLVTALFVTATPAFSQPRGGDDRDVTLASVRAEIRRLRTQQMHQGLQVLKEIDDWMWFSRLADIAEVDKVHFTSSKPARSQDPGGHYFNRIDTPLAKESRKEVWAFLARHLK